jgi:hypothetical protein
VRIRELGIGVGVCVLAVITTFLLGELALRLYYEAQRMMRPQSAPVQRTPPFRLDQKLGWRAMEHLTFEYETANGTLIRYLTTRDGFREYGDPDSPKARVLVIGDSFTEAREVSNENTYYRVLSQLLPVEIFAYGGGGYGSLQEYLILDEHIDAIRPHVVLWQFTSNDLINNSEELERASYLNNNGLRRPYLRRDGTIYYANPKPAAAVREFANHYSRLLYLILSRWDIIKARFAQGESRKLLESVEISIGKVGGQHAGFQQAIHTTSEIMKRVRQRAGAARVVAFVSHCSNEFCDALEAIASSAGIEFIPGVAEVVSAAQEQGRVVLADDGAHWNELGHALVAQVIADHFRERSISGWQAR